MEGTLGLRVQYPLLKKKISTTGSILSASKEKKVGLLVYIKATGEKGAEMVTEEGAIYVTSNRGYNWKAAVQETVLATLNSIIGRIGFGNWKGIGLVIMAVVAGVWKQRRGNVKVRI
ncbi:hypothetical protein RJT34_30701 [Clitoria ternatea]|uniref:Photosynthesis system II assembly factor Ycf48/Hcf136-like domain-containing protein n=1 Tax=Clitoria ternatea TaxID=43366 RepID=A0AAN9EV28_CLITE